MKSNIGINVGETVYGKSGNVYRLGSLLGSDSKGIAFVDASERYVVKMYFPYENQILNDATLDRIIFLEGIGFNVNFVSLIDVIIKPGIGYVMERLTGYQSLDKYLIQPNGEEFSAWYKSGYGFKERLLIGCAIAEAFSEMEKSGLSYCDISGNSILVKLAKDAEVKMIDIDKIYVPGKGNASVICTSQYIAPEVIGKTHNPDIVSDKYSLAVILFELLRMGHPYIGDDAIERDYDVQVKPITEKMDYVGDGHSSNMLPENIVFTGKMKELFRRCFVDAKTDRMLRPSAKEYYYAFMDAGNKIIKCHHCGAWHYPSSEADGWLSCPWCDGKSKSKTRIDFYNVLYEFGSRKKQGTKIISFRLQNSYILRDGEKNIIKSYYIYETDKADIGDNLSNNYMTIVKTASGCFLHNEFKKEGIIVKQARNNKSQIIDPEKYILLESGDEIYFAVDKNKPVSIKMNGQIYSFLKMARFMEE